MPRSREIPHDFASSTSELADTTRKLGADTNVEALMQTAPGEATYVTAPSLEALAPLREVLADALEALCEEDQWIVNALVIERLSIRDVAAQLGLSKSSVHRYRDRAFARLREALEDNPTVKRFISE